MLDSLVESSNRSIQIDGPILQQKATKIFRKCGYINSCMCWFEKKLVYWHPSTLEIRKERAVGTENDTVNNFSELNEKYVQTR